MKKLSLNLCLIFICLTMAACSLFQKDTAATKMPVAHVTYPDTRFIVISDLHFYDNQLGTEGAAFQNYLNKDRKLLELSDEIIATAMEQISKDPAEFVLVAGDLTKDGEMVCHKGVAEHLKTLKNSGKKIFVVPGNHDLNNPESVRYDGKATIPVTGTHPDNFENIYREFGYGQAIARDPASLSYIAEPAAGLWVLALDSNRYKENRPDHHPIVGGAFSDLTLAWVKQQLSTAQKEGKAVIVLQHHGIMEHYPANEKFYSQYIVDDYEKFASLLAEFGVRLVFTGHFHAQDVTQMDVELENGKAPHRIFDIETGSLVTAPCPYRIIDITQDNKGFSNASVSSRFIKAIPSMGTDFESYAANFVFEGTRKLANTSLAKYRVAEDQHDLINSQIAKAYAAHLNGDEKIPETVIDTKGFGVWLRFVAWMQEDLLEGWWTDLPPGDNNLTINLATGQVQ